MLSNHFPNTYGHDLNWLILLIITAGGAAIREYFVVRLSNPKRSMTAAVVGIALIAFVMVWTSVKNETVEKQTPVVKAQPAVIDEMPVIEIPEVTAYIPIEGHVVFEGPVPENKKLTLPSGCDKLYSYC
jgi:uncharacterized membrane protein